MLEYICGRILGVVLFIPLLFLYSIDTNVCEKVVHIIAPSINDLIRIKMSKKNYMIPINVIDCPISIKQQLYNEINGSSKYLLTKHNGRLYVCDVSFSGKVLDIEHNEDVKYLLNQLVEGDITTHIFRQFSTKWVDENNKDIKPEFVGNKTKDKEDFSDYTFVSTETVDGNLIHHYRQYTTEWVAEDNTPLKDKFTGKEVKDSGIIPNYKFLETKTDDKGNVKHIFAQFTTSWIDENNKNLAEPTKSDEFKKEEQFEGYKLIDTKEEGRTKVYTYHKLTTEWVEDKTNTQLKKQDGTHEHGDITSYVYVKTETKENGDLVHVFKKVEQKTEQSKKNDIPTGVRTNSLISLFMILISSIGLVLTNVIKKRES